MLPRPAIVAIPALLLCSCSSGPAETERLDRRSPNSPTWGEVVSWDPGPEVTDARMRRAVAEGGRPWKVRDRATGIEMVLILPGEFSMGSPPTEVGRGDDEGPSHLVRITRPFYLGSTEVTQEQWRRSMGPTPSFFSGDGLPIDPSWNDIAAFLDRANAGLPDGAEPLRLPTEAEWEYACRAGTANPFSFAGPIDHTLVNFNDGTVGHAVVVDGALEVEWMQPPSPECRMRTAPAGSLPANPWGLHEMHGNLWEWCEDRYSPEGYSGREGGSVDPFVPAGPDDLRTLRGGSWYDAMRFCRAAVRDAGGPSVRSNRIGFRVARTAPLGDR